MRYNKIMFFFFIALPICIVLRLMQLIYTVDFATGFFKQEFKTFGGYILLIIFGFAAASVIFAFTAHRRPEHPPCDNIFLDISGVLLALSLLSEIFTESMPVSLPMWQGLLLRISGFAAAVYFVLLALKNIFNFHLPKAMAVFPVVYMVSKIICNFSVISSLALISDNILLLSAYCSGLLFFLNYAKLYNGLDSEYNFRKLLATGLLTVLFSFTQSIGHIVINILTSNAYTHTTLISNIFILFMGIFAAIFILFHFSHKNACE